jgi:hypothetical protein
LYSLSFINCVLHFLYITIIYNEMYAHIHVYVLVCTHTHTFFFLFCGEILGFGLRASCLLGRCSTIWVTALVMFWIESCVFALADFGPGSSCLHLLCSYNDRCKGHHPQIIGWDRVSLTFCLGWPQTVIFLISASWVAGIIDMRYCTWSTHTFLCLRGSC